jgi:hypothetical protein
MIGGEEKKCGLKIELQLFTMKSFFFSISASSKSQSSSRNE